MTTERCVRPKRRKIKWMRILFICVMLAYPSFQLVLFWLSPNFDSLISAFIKINPRLGLREFSFSNFQKLFREFGTPDSQLMRGVINSFWHFVATVVVGIPLTILLAYFIYKKIFGSKVFRVIFFLPSIISGVVLATLFVTFIQYPVSPFNQLMAKIMKVDPIDTPDLLSKYKVLTICVYTVWTGFGVNLVMFNTAMHRVPADVIEYGKIEGVGMVRELVQIVIPMIFPTLTTVLLLGIAGYFTFIQPVMLFRPMPNGDLTGTSWSVAYYIYYLFKGKTRPDVNYACAVGVFFAAVGTPVVIGIKWLMNKAVAAVEY